VKKIVRKEIYKHRQKDGFVTVDFSLQLILTLILTDIVFNLIREHLETFFFFDFHVKCITWT